LSALHGNTQHFPGMAARHGAAAPIEKIIKDASHKRNETYADNTLRQLPNLGSNAFSQKMTLLGRH
jgi:hypothetical protein